MTKYSKSLVLESSSIIILQLFSLNFKVIPISSRRENWRKCYPLDSILFGFFSDFHWNMSRISINIYNIYNIYITYIIMLMFWEKVSKTFKKRSLGTLFRKQ